MKQHELVCISCPVGCSLVVTISEDGDAVKGNKCRLGAVYGVKEVKDPRRILTTSIKVYHESKDSFRMLSVKTDGDIPKGRMMECLAVIKSLDCRGNIQVGDVLIENILDFGVNVVATRQIHF